MASSSHHREAARPQPYESVDRSRAGLDDTEAAAESPGQSQIIGSTHWSVNELARMRGDAVFVGRHTFFAWDKDDPAARVAPDIYLVDGPPPDPYLRIWQEWKPGFRRPRWALEVVSWDWRKDYVENLPKYARLGCSELVIFDPMRLLQLPVDGEARRKPLTIFRLKKDGKLHRFYSGNGPAYSRQLRVWLATGCEGYQPMIRLWLDKAGKKVVPTDDEVREKYASLAEEHAFLEEKHAFLAEDHASLTEEHASLTEEYASLASLAEDQTRREEELRRRVDELRLQVDEERAGRQRLAERFRGPGINFDVDD